MQIVVQHITGSKQGMTENFNTQSLSIGRDPTNDLSFDPSVDLDVSSRHAQVNVIPGQGFQLVDLGSTNGTYVNGQKVNGAIPLQNGSLVEFGKNGVKVQFRFQEAMGQMPGMGMPPGMGMQPGMQHAGMMAGGPPPQQMGPPQKGARTKMFEAAIDKSKKDAKSTKRMLCCSVIGFVFLGLLGVGIFLYVQNEEAATRAWHAKDNAENSKDLADAGRYAEYPESKAIYDKADSHFEEGDELYENWEYDAAEEEWAKAEKLYTQADTEAKTQHLLALQNEQNRQALAAIAREKEESEARFRESHQDLMAEITAARDEGRDENEIAAMEEMRAAMERDNEVKEEEFNERAAVVQKEIGQTIVQNRYWIVCRVTSQAWIMREQTKVIALGQKVVGSGVFITAGGKEYILTAKSVAKPHLYDLESKGVVDYYNGLGGNYSQYVDTKAEVYVPLASDDGLSSEWRVLFERSNSSLGLGPVGHEDPAEFTEGVEVQITIDQTARRQEGVKILKDNENNWALFEVNMKRAFPENAEGRAKMKEIHGGPTIAYQRLAQQGPRDYDPVTVIGIEGDKAVPFDERIQDGDPFSLDESFKQTFIGAPVFNDAGDVVGLIVRQDDARQLMGISATHVEP